MIYDLKTTFLDNAAPSALTVTAGLLLGTPLDLSTLQTGLTPASNVTPQWPYGGATPGVQLRNVGNGQAFYLVIKVRNSATNSVIVGATGTMSINLITADDNTLTTNAQIVASSPTYANQTLAGGTIILLIDVPVFNMRRFLGLKIIIGTVSLTGTCIMDAFLTNDPAVWQAYAQPQLN